MTTIERLAKIALKQGWQQQLIDCIINMEYTQTAIARLCSEQSANRQQTTAIVDLVTAVRTNFLVMVNTAIRS